VELKIVGVGVVGGGRSAGCGFRRTGGPARERSCAVLSVSCREGRVGSAPWWSVWCAAGWGALGTVGRSQGGAAECLMALCLGVQGGCLSAKA